MHIRNNNIIQTAVVRSYIELSKMMMKKMWVWMWLTLLSCDRCHGCFEEERSGLLEIKALINPNSIFGHLSDWNANKEDIANCCEWYGIKCDSTTRRVIQLSLAGARDFRLGDWVLNASLFLPFKELQGLNLSTNRLVGCFENEGFEVLSSELRKLNVLDLSGNRFSNNLVSCFNGFSSLKSLDLSNNPLKRAAGFQVLSSRLKNLESLSLKMNEYNDSIFSTLTGLSSLKSLDLSYNHLTGSVAGFNAFQLQPTSLRKLENLDLSRNQLNSNISSILSGLLSLKSLDLSYNKLTASGFEVLPSKLRKLESLDLSYNEFNDGDLSHLCEFPFLKSLNLSGNKFSGSTTINGLRKLEVLSMNELTITGTTLLQSLGTLPSLKTLSLKETNLSGTSIIQGTFFNSTTLEELILDGSSFPINNLQNIGAFSGLKILSFSECNLNSILPAKGWCELKNLEQLDISWNNLRGSLPDCFRNFSSLQLLDVSGNRFTGNIASGPLSSLISLEFLSLSNNHFEVPLSFNSFMNHSKLKFFICDHSTLILRDKAGFQNFIPKLQLMFFSLSSRKSKALNADIPNFLYSQYDLRILDLSHNNFTGMFPSWLLKNNTRLEQLYLRENSFSGPLILQNQPNPYMTVVDISNNKISGQVPRNICSVFPDLSILRMAMNGITGCLPYCFGNMSSLEHMDLSDNQLSTVKLEQLKSSWIVNLSNNNLVGQIPPSIFNSSAFLYLYLDGNNFTGQISGFPPPNWIHLSALDISSNQLSGMLPAWMGNFSYLKAMDLSRNHFQGPIPRDFCDLGSLKYLDMSENNLLGSVPSCFGPSTIKHVHLSKNQLSGPLTNAFYNSSSLVTLDLNYNNFMGPISNWIGNLSVLSVLLLKANYFSGEFPTQLCLLERLSILDVSQNKLSGFLPSCLANYSFKQNLDKAAAFHERTFKIKSISKMYSETNLLLGRIDNQGRSFRVVNIEEAIEFTTKRRPDDYKGTVLNFMTGFDLSSNRFSGEIPLEMGKLSELHALNLSHNNLTGSIPTTFSNLKQIESLDLSHNNLDGVIPPQLVVLNNLAVFSVAHNNLSGKAPERKDQFATFDESSYEGNPFLCGPPLENKCSEEESPSQPMPNDEREDDGFIDMDVFYVSFGVCYIIVVLTIAAVLYINPLWRGRWFHFTEECIDICYSFLVVNFRKFSNFRRS